MNEHTRAMQKQYRIDHKEELKEKKRVYYLKNKEKIKEYEAGKRQIADADERSLKAQTYYEQHADAINAKAREKRRPGILHRAMLKEFRSKYWPWNEGIKQGIYQIDF